jgi:hypothetical chaperone protein
MAPTVAIGMDFGTSNSSIAIYDGREITLLPIDPAAGNPNVARTILYVTHDHEVSIGAEAVQLYYSDNIGRPRHFVKKWVGEIEFEGAEMFYVRDIYAYVDEFQPGRLLQYLKTALRTPGYGGTLIFGRFYHIEELVTIYLRMARERASILLEQEVDQVVLGRPVHFAPTPEADAFAQSRLLEAAQAAGFRKVAFEMEPIAAALDYASTIAMPENILVFDFGGGTLDITVMRVGGMDQHIYAVGGVDIAGSNFDTAIIREKMLPHFGYGSIYGGKNNFPVPKEMVENISDWMTLPTIATPETKTLLDEIIATSPDACRVNNLRSLIFNEYGFSFYSTVEEAKIRLSEDYATAVDFRVEDIEVWQMLTRLQFERILQPYLDSVYVLLINTLADAGLEASEIDRIITTGGSSSIPAFNQMLEEMFGAEKVLPTSPFTSVTAGLAIKAHKVFG